MPRVQGCCPQRGPPGPDCLLEPPLSHRSAYLLLTGFPRKLPAPTPVRAVIIRPLTSPTCRPWSTAGRIRARWPPLGKLPGGLPNPGPRAGARRVQPNPTDQATAGQHQLPTGQRRRSGCGYARPVPRRPALTSGGLSLKPVWGKGLASSTSWAPGVGIPLGTCCARPRSG